MQAQAKRLANYSQMLESGLLTTTEAVAGVLDTLADSQDAALLWATAPEPLRREVREYIAHVSPVNAPEAYVVGADDPERRAAQTARRCAVAARLLAEFA
jgi:hypothetical protein